MDKDKVLISLLTGISPLVFSFIVKAFESKREAIVHKNKMEEAQNRISFIDNYFQLQSKFLGETELMALKVHLSSELTDIKNTIDALFIKLATTTRKKISFVQRLFLTFRPLSWIGWVLVVLFYFGIIFTCFALLGFGLDKDTNQFSFNALSAELRDTDSLIGISFFILVVILLRYFALLDYKRRCKKLSPHTA